MTCTFQLNLALNSDASFVAVYCYISSSLFKKEAGMGIFRRGTERESVSWDEYNRRRSEAEAQIRDLEADLPPAADASTTQDELRVYSEKLARTRRKLSRGNRKPREWNGAAWKRVCAVLTILLVAAAVGYAYKPWEKLAATIDRQPPNQAQDQKKSPMTAEELRNWRYEFSWKEEDSK